ncbi:CHASE2 domain-containing protein [Scytonema hofmannii FACHB-248]|uniref:CHASE2 domain-containing protein n=1 Tax=Scytonema hofmannii FACHB-248 TaxID=1842502 RepID=A0ABR8GPY6_9CYAN|nr:MULTISPECIES: CHASE2 domain-containing protein [Nostocales]MBD2605287.1 CHASE2 domain-containing protein [Scytonema hofmannii FACHB-248]
MSKLVVLNLGRGDLKRGFPSVTVQLWEEGNPIAMQFTGSLPPASSLWQLYRRWQLLYQLLYEALYPSLGWRRYVEKQDEEIEIDEEDVTNISSVDFINLCDDLSKGINTWLKSETFRNIDQKLRTTLAPNDEIRVILATEDEEVKRLPWHLWNFFEDYQSSIVGISAAEIAQVKPLPKKPGDKLRILAIIGNSEGIDLEKDKAILEQLPGAETVFLVEPQRKELDKWLWDKQGWDILFFAGHGSTQTDGETGRIHINKTDYLTVPQLKNALKAAIARGLRLAIFNSCDGLSLARNLASLQIPQMIVMREPVPDLVAQEFLKHFLAAFADGESFYLAMREAQDRLQGLENEFPCASWLPVMCQNPSSSALVWQKPILTSTRKSLPSRRILQIVFQVSLFVTALIIGMRSLGNLQSSELMSFDHLMRSRPYEAQDQRILIVGVTEVDVRTQPPKERGGASLSDKTLALVVKKLEQFKPRAIGLDIYRENPVSADYPDLANTMENSDRFFAICKASEEDKNPGVPPPPEVSLERQGFSDVVIDPDEIIRRQLLAIAPALPCSTDKSFNFRLANRYLADLGIIPQLNTEKNFQFGNVVFKNLEKNSGGYHGIDYSGHQILLNWRSSPQIAPEVTIKQILNNELTPDLVRDRIVIIGTTAESFHDYWSTPYSAQKMPYQRMPGIVVQAHMVSQILSAVLDRRPLLSVLPKWGEVLWVWSWSISGGIIAWYFRSPSYLGIAIACGLIILYGVCLYILIQGVWIPLVPSALVFVASSLIVTLYTKD